MNINVNLSLREVEDIEEATHIFVEDRPLGINVERNKLYELHEKEINTYDLEGAVTMHEYYIIDEDGKENYGILNSTSNMLCKLVIK